MRKMAWDETRGREVTAGAWRACAPSNGILIQHFTEQSGQAEHVRWPDLAWRPQLLNRACFPNVFDHKAASCVLGIAHGLA